MFLRLFHWDRCVISLLSFSRLEKAIEGLFLQSGSKGVTNSRARAYIFALIVSGIYLGQAAARGRQGLIVLTRTGADIYTGAAWGSRRLLRGIRVPVVYIYIYGCSRAIGCGQWIVYSRKRVGVWLWIYEVLGLYIAGCSYLNCVGWWFDRDAMDCELLLMVVSI